MLKKTTLAVIGLAASSFASAGTMGPVCTPGNVTVPCEANRWDLGLQALYLQSVYSASKAFQLVLPAAPSPATALVGIRNNWDWAFRAEGSYSFKTGNDLSVDWMHFRSANGIAGYVTDLFLPVGGAVVPLVSDEQIANRNRLDQVNVVLGQHVDAGAVDNLRFYGGMQYANLQTNVVNYFTTPLPQFLAPITSVNLFNNADFKGFGPVVGIDYSYDITDAISVTANGSASILYGTSRYNLGFLADPLEVILASVYGSAKTIVPTVAAKLGLNYGYTMANGVVNVEGGYQVLNYFNVLQTQAITPVNVNNLVTKSNYGLYGPYFGVKYSGNA